MRYQIFLYAIALILAFPGAGKAEILSSPFPEIAHPIEINHTECAEHPPSPPENLDFPSIYKEGSVDEIDPAALQAYENQKEPIRIFERFLVKQLDTYRENLQEKADGALCAMQWLHSWAERRALLTQANATGQAVRKWTLASMSSVFVQIQDMPGLDPEKTDTIAQWLNLLARYVRYEYSLEPDKNSHNNNHVYWAAWAVMITGIATQDRELYDWAVSEYKDAIDQIDNDGTLPLELARKSRAFHYHVFAAAPLVMIAETAAINDQNLYDYKNGRIHLLVNRIILEMDSGFYYMTAITLKAQKTNKTLNSSQLAWLEPYARRFDNDLIRPWIKAFRPFKQHRFGGNLTLAYSLEEIE